MLTQLSQTLFFEILVLHRTLIGIHWGKKSLPVEINVNFFFYFWRFYNIKWKIKDSGKEYAELELVLPKLI